MSVFPEFYENDLKTRDDVMRFGLATLQALQPYTKNGRTKLPILTGTGFDETAAQIEGFARPLWLVADLAALSTDPIDCSRLKKPLFMRQTDQAEEILDLRIWTDGLVDGTNPTSEYYWGDLGDFDQRMVEMEPIAYALLAAPESFVPRDDKARSNLVVWLRQIYFRKMPQSNWLWFRVLVSLALIKSLGVPADELKAPMENDLAVLETFDLGQGWSSDGLWGEERKQADYYSGSFAIQYSRLAYIRFAEDIDPERCAQYRREAAEFATSFWRYFDINGAAVPFGRSLTYRFAFAAFWSAAVVAGVDLPQPVRDLAVVKGILLRHLRWWRDNGTGIFNLDGTLNIGYTYPNMYMSEDYNSPQSPYWSLKTLSILGLPEHHAFWTCPELSHPLADTGLASAGTDSQENLKDRIAAVAAVPAPRQILCGTKEHHFLLSSGQATKMAHKAREAKYGKFAYSSSFGFSVSIGSLLEQLAPDSTLAVSKDDGESWKVRWDPLDVNIDDFRVISVEGTFKGTTPAITSSWKPWKNSELMIRSTLIPVVQWWPGWHIRVHRVSSHHLSQQAEIQERVTFLDGGFAVPSHDRLSKPLRRHESQIDPDSPAKQAKLDGVWVDRRSCLIISTNGTSGIIDFTERLAKGDANLQSKAICLKPDANTSIVFPRTLIPMSSHKLITPIAPSKISDLQGELFLVTGVFAVSPSAGLSLEETRKLWLNPPAFNLEQLLRGDS